MKIMIKVAAATCLALMLSLTFTGKSWATSYTFASNDGSGTRNDLNDLDHYKLYVWGIDPSNALASIKNKNEKITGARINFKNIYNWANEDNDILKVYLVDNPKVKDPLSGIDVWSATDNQSTTAILSELTDPLYRDTNINNTKYRFSAIQELWTWTDVIDMQHERKNGKPYGHDLEYVFDSSELANMMPYLLSPNLSSTAKTRYATFGLGFDPDCHYFNDGITFTIETTPVPEPGTLILLGAGLLGFGLFGRRRQGKK